MQRVKSAIYSQVVVSYILVSFTSRGYPMKVAKKISFWSAVLMSINIIVGAGIFFNPQSVTHVAGSFGFLIWPLLGLLLFPVIWSLAQATTVFPGEGGFYNYCATAFNPTAGFLAHWAYLVGYIGTAATFCAAIKWLLVTQTNMHMVEDYPILVNFLLVLLVSALNMMQLNLVTKLQSGAALIKMIPLVFVIALAAFYWGPHLSFNSGDLNNLCSAIGLAIFSFLGFEVCCSISGMIEGGAKKASKAILTAFFIAMTAYMLYHLGLLYIMGVNKLADHGPVAFPQFLGFSSGVTNILQTLITFFIFFSVANALYGVFLMNVTNLHALAKRNLITGSSALSIVNAYDRPTVAIAVHGLAVFLLVTFVPSLTVLMALTSTGVCLAFFMTVLALFSTYYRQKNHTQLAITALAFCSCAVMIYYGWLEICKDPVSRVVLFVGLVGGFVMYKLHTGMKAKRK